MAAPSRKEGQLMHQHRTLDRLRDAAPAGLRRRIGPPLRALRHPGDVRRSDILQSRSRRLPDLLVIGAAKAGTSSLFYGLKQHPAFRGPSTKEVNYFSLHYGLGAAWYRAHFPAGAAGDGCFSADASPYYLFHPHAPTRAAELLPQARIIALVREPIARAYSHYQHNRREGREPLTFANAVDAEHERIDRGWARMLTDEWHDNAAVRSFSYLARGRYAEQLERWLRVFPREQMLVMRSEDYFADPNGTLRRVLKFSGLPDFEPAEPKHRNKGGYDDGIEPEIRAKLVEHFREPNRRLAELFGPELSW
jgi:hypothetical protein